MTQQTSKDQGNGETAMARPKTAAQTVQGWMANPTMSASLAAALGGYMDFKQFAAQCYITAQDPDLARCSAESLMRAFLETAQMGLLPGPAHKHVALIPRNGIITVQPEYRGFCFLMERQPGVKRVKPELVHTSDEFEVTAGGGVHHKYDPFNPERIFLHPEVAKKEKKECGLRGGYLEVQYDDGRVEYHFTPFHQIEKQRACADTQKVWEKWYSQQALKSVVRDAFARRVVPIDPTLAVRVERATSADNKVLGNDPNRASSQLAPATRTQGVAALLGVGEDVPDMTRVASASEVVEATIDPPPTA